MTMTLTNVTDTIKAQYPEAYHIAGIGWCGPDWQQAALLEAAIYGNRARVAMNFAITTNSDTEALLAYLSARTAAHHALSTLEGGR